MARDTIIYKCECCGAKIHINFQTRSVTFLEGPGGHKAPQLDELVAEQARDSERREELFKDAFDRNLHEKERLEKLFDEARKKVGEEKDVERPPSPFDME